MRRAVIGLVALATLSVSSFPIANAAGDPYIGINVVLTKDISADILHRLSAYGTVNDQYPAIDAVTMKARSSSLDRIRSLRDVAAANPDAKRVGQPVPSSPFEDTTNGMATWNLDQIDVYEQGNPDRREVTQTGEGVYVAVLDTGLLSSWRYYFGESRIATEFGIAFGGGGGEKGTVSTQPNKWSLDQNGHGTHVTSTILGFNLRGVAVGGVAPRAKVIPVKVLNQNGSGQSSVVAAGIMYVANLKASGKLGGAPVVINMSLGGPQLDAIEKAALDYALNKGVLIVASAGNNGTAGMGYPGAYTPVISVAANGWTGEWQPGPDGVPNNWWHADDVPDPTAAAHAYITDFSSRELPGQDLDLSAPGSWVVGPYQTNGQLSYYFLGGTSMASPHVAGAVALMLQKNASLTQAQADTALTSSATPLPPGCRIVRTGPAGDTAQYCWETGADSREATGAGILNVPRALAATP